MIHLQKKLLYFSFFFLIISLFTSCAVSKKIQAGNILSQTKLSFKSVQLDSIVLHPELFKKINSLKTSILPNPQVIGLVQNLAKGIIESELGSAYLNIELQLENTTQDSLWLHSLDAVLELDSLIKLPLILAEKSLLLPGSQTISIKTTILLDQNLLKIMDVKKAHFIGKMNVSLSEKATPLPLDFDYSRDISPEEMNLLQQRARESILNNIVGDWVKAIL